MKKASRIIAFTLIMVLTFGVFATSMTTRKEYEERLDAIVNYIKEVNINSSKDDDPIKRTVLDMFEKDPEFYYEFMENMLSSYDRYSHYLSSEKYNQMYKMNNSYVGIGVLLEMVDGFLTVTNVVSQKAEEAGLKVGDVLVSVDGMRVEGFNTDMLRQLTLGKQGSVVKMVVRRQGKEIPLNIERATIQTSNVSYFEVEPGIGYIKLDYFNGINTYLDFSNIYEELPEKGIKTVILDLRNNPGGDLSCMINIMDTLVREKGIPFLWAQQANMKLTAFATERGGVSMNKIVILTNQYSASASEVLAGAMRDLNYADLVGVTTYGKGYGQNHVVLNNDDMLIMSTFELLLPLTGKYDGIGIKPTYYQKMGYKEYKLPELAPINKTRGIYPNTEMNVLAVEQRLHELGYFLDTPDKVPNEYTFFAINLFQKALEIPVTQNGCTADTVLFIDQEVQKLKGRKIPVDTQFNKALEVARRNKSFTVLPKAPPLESLRFFKED